MQGYHTIAQKEQKVLKLSVGLTFVLAISAALTGFLVNASSIMFDGVYALIDGVFSMAALLVARLISLDTQRQEQNGSSFIGKFNLGFWHLEPLVLTINSGSLIGAVIYAFLDSTQVLLSGGSQPEFLPALVFAGFAMVLSFAMAIYEHKINKTIDSDFIAIDEKSWLISALINAALILAFGIGLIFAKTDYGHLVRYIDPLILAMIALSVLPMPVKILRDALKGILLITPKEESERIEKILQKIVQKYGFESFYHYVALVGRSLSIEIHIVVPKNYECKRVEFFDQIRQEISDEIGEAGPDRWFTVSFTADEKWAI